MRSRDPGHPLRDIPTVAPPVPSNTEEPRLRQQRPPRVLPLPSM